MVKEFIPKEAIKTPYSESMEKSVLSSLFQYTDLPDEATVNKSLFFIPAHQIIYHEIQSLGRPVDLSLLVQKLIDSKKIESVGGPSGVMEIFTYQPTSTYFKSHLKKLHGYAARRQAIEAANNLLVSAYDLSDDEDYLDKTKAPMDAVAAIAQATVKERNRDDILKNMASQLEARLTSQTAITGWLTGIAAVDDVFNGLHPKQLSVIGGFPTSGKTVFAVQALLHIALCGTPTLVISLEMTEENLASNSLIMASGLPCLAITKPFEYAQSLGSNRPTKEHIARIKKGMELVKKAPIYYEAPEGRGNHITQIELMIRRNVKKNGVKVVAVDFLQRMKGPKSQSREQELSFIVNELQSLEKELNIHIMLLSQLNKNGEHKHAEAINEAADMAINIAQIMDKESSDYRKHIGLSIRKDKHNGRTGDFLDVVLDKTHLKFREKQEYE